MVSKKRDDDEVESSTTEDAALLGFDTGENIAITKQTAVMGDNLLHDEDEVLAVEQEDSTGDEESAAGRPFRSH